MVFAHVPLWTVSAQWGWGTDDAEQALVLLRRFGSVTVLNGHIHQVMQKVEGNVAFHTALSTAFPQPAPGTAPSPGPIKDLPAGRLRSVLGITQVTQVPGRSGLAITDTALASAEAQVTIDNFSFNPAALTIPAGTRVTWTNRDDIPHTVTDATDPRGTKSGGTKSGALDTGASHARTFATAGTFAYFCSLHPHMQGTVVVH